MPRASASTAKRMCRAGLSGVTAIACGDYHDLALKSGRNHCCLGTEQLRSGDECRLCSAIRICSGDECRRSRRWREQQYRVARRRLGGHLGANMAMGNIRCLRMSPMSSPSRRAARTSLPCVRMEPWSAGAEILTDKPPFLPSWTNIVAISAGGSHSVALRNDGTILTLGNYINGPTLHARLGSSDLGQRRRHRQQQRS